MEKIYTAKLLEEAKEQAYREFEEMGADRDEVQITILEQPVKKLFGSKGDYKISAVWEPIGEESVKEADSAAAAVAAPAAAVSAPNPAAVQQNDGDGYEEQPAAHEAAEPDDDTVLNCAKIQRATKYLDQVLKALGIEDFTIEPVRKGDMVILNIAGDNLGVVIGRRGETLDALQYLTILAGNRGEDNYCRISIDCCDYREKRREALETLAAKTARKVLKTGRRVTLEPMNPYERRIIHSKVAEIDGVASRSTGEEPYRKVMISSTESHRSGGRRQGGGRPNSYKQSSGFSTSFEREYKRREAPAPEAADYSEETVEFEKSSTLYGKIEL